MSVTEITNPAKYEVVCEGLTSIFEIESQCITKEYENDSETLTINNKLQEIQNEIEKYNTDIDKLTNHADGLDYIISVASGVLCGIIDILFVDDLSFEKANEWGDEKVNNFVVKIAQQQGYKGDDLYGAVKFLEEKYPIAADKATNQFGGGRQHHLRDFSHHPTPIGLIFSLLTQFTSKVYGTDTAGFFKIVPLDKEGLTLVGKNFPEKIAFGVINWFFHMVSDIAGSSNSILEVKAGTGLPGPLVALLKEISSLPIFKNLNLKGYKEFSVWISKLFNGTLLGKRDEAGKLVPIKFDLRTELGLLPQLGKQAIPIIINECVVRGFYFIRHLCIELKKDNVKSFEYLKNIDWSNTLPFKNRTIIRMLTISLAVFEVIDLADAAIESAIKSGGNSAMFVENMIVKVNFIGIGRFAIAVGTDIGMGIKRNRLDYEKLQLLHAQFNLYNAKTANNISFALETISDNHHKIVEQGISNQQSILEAKNNLAAGRILDNENQKKMEELL